MTLVTFGRTSPFSGMAALAVGMGGILEGCYLGIGDAGGLVVAALTFLDLLAIHIGDLFAGGVLGVMTITAGRHFLMFGMVEGGWFWLGGGIFGSLQGDFGGAFVGSHGVRGKSQAQCQGKGCGVDYGFFHHVPPFD